MEAEAEGGSGLELENQPMAVSWRWNHTRLLLGYMVLSSQAERGALVPPSITCRTRIIKVISIHNKSDSRPYRTSKRLVRLLVTL